MAEKGFGIKQLDIIGSTGTPLVESKIGLNFRLGGQGPGGIGHTVGIGTTGLATWLTTKNNADPDNVTTLNCGIITANYVYGTFKGIIDPTSSTISLNSNIQDVLNVAANQISADDAGADKIVFWDDDTGKLTHLGVGTGLQISGTTLNATADAGKTYQLKCTKDADGGDTGTDADPYLFLDASSGTDDSVRIVGGTNINVTRNDGGQLTIEASGTATTNEIIQGNTKAEVIDTGIDGHFKVTTEGTEKLRIESDGDCLFLGGVLRIKDSGNSAQRGSIYGDASSFHINAGVNNLIAYSAGTERLRITSTGAWGIEGASNYGTSGQILTSNGNDSPTWQTGTSATTVTVNDEGSSSWRDIVYSAGSGSGETLRCNDTTGAVNGLQVRASDGAIRVKGDITAYRSSDITLKDNISPIKNALAKVSSISGNTFTWNEKSTDDKQGKDDTGVIAQEITALGLPGVTTTREDGTQAVMYEKLVPLLIEAIKELKEEVDELKSRS